MVKEWSRAGSTVSLVFVRTAVDARDPTDMMVADYEHGELNLVRLEMNGNALSKWLRERQWNENLVRRPPASPRQTD